jgi:hypothetical protein
MGGALGIILIILVVVTGYITLFHEETPALFITYAFLARLSEITLTVAILVIASKIKIKSAT